VIGDRNTCGAVPSFYIYTGSNGDSPVADLPRKKTRMSETVVVPLPELTRRLQRMTTERVPGYFVLYRMILDGRLDSERHGKRYYVNLDTAIKTLGLTREPVAA
jgi:hypothetical protein